MSVVCYNCFKEIPDDSECCPFCGFDKEKNREKFPQALPFGSILSGRYITGRVLGQGGFGITYVATDHKTKSLVAIKEFFPDAMAVRSSAISVSPYSGERGENFAYGKASFLQEAKTMAEFIGNPNIVRVHSYFEENGTAYFVMEYVVGKSFQQMIAEKGGKLSWEEAVNVIAPVLNALAAVHSKGIIHRDVTPDNIYITEDGTVKLLDFGAARYSLGDVSRSLDVVLKHGFAPKEQYSRWGKQGPYTDIYCVAASLYYALTGHKPPDAIDRMERDELIPPSALGVRITREQENTLIKALSVSPADRYQRAQDFLESLQSVSPNVDAALEAAVKKMNQIDPSKPSEELIVRYREVIELFSQLPGNDKAKKYIRECEKKIAEQERLQQEKLEQKRKKKLFIIIGAAMAVLVISLILIIFALTRPKSTMSSGFTYTPAETQGSQTTQTGQSGQSGQTTQEKTQARAPELSAAVSPDHRTLEVSLVCFEDYTSVRFPIWSENNDQDDLKAYPAEKNSGGKTWTCSVALAEHGDLGAYHIHAYAEKNGEETKVASTSVNVEEIITPVLSAEVSKDNRTINIRLTNGQAYTKVLFPTWSKENGQDDLSRPWPEGQKQSDGSWTCSIDLAEHGDLGTYIIHAYGYINDWSAKVSKSNVEVTTVNIPMVTAKVSQDNSAIDIVVTGAEAESGVRLWVWSAENDQDDKRGYTAQQNGNGSWTCSVGLNNHGDTGTYYIHAYAVRDGKEEYISQTSVDVRKIACPAIRTTLSADRETMRIVMSGASKYTGVEFAIWKEGSEDKLDWPSPELQIDGSYVCTIKLSDFGGIGIYHVDVYIENRSKTIASIVRVLQ